MYAVQRSTYRETYLEKVWFLCWNVEQKCIFLVSVHKVGTELWVILVVKVLIMGNIKHLHISRHERFAPVGRHPDEALKLI